MSQAAIAWPLTPADCVGGTDKIELLHLSGYSMMSGSLPARLRQMLEKKPPRFPIIGHTTAIGSDACVPGYFTFLSLLVIHGLDPDAAVREAIRVAPHPGKGRIRGSVYRPPG